MNLNAFLKAHPALNYANDLREICAPLNLLDIVYFSHAKVDLKNNLSALAIVPDFFKLYFEKGYHNFDLHMANPRQGEEYIIWDMVQRKKQSYSLHQDFMSFNQGHTFSIVINHDSGKDCYHFATRLGNDKMNGEYLQLIDKLKKFIVYFNEKIAKHKQLLQAYELKIPLEIKQGGYITEECPFDLHKFNESIEAKNNYPLNGNYYLSDRELECLSWIAQGKTFQEIAIILGVSPRTIKAHVANIKEKSGCNNLFQLGMHYSKLI